MQFVENFPERTYKSMLIPMMQEEKRAGETTCKGFYVYDDKRKANPDPEIKKFIQKARDISGIVVDPKLVKLSDKDIIEMIFFPVVNEACRVLAEGIAVKAADLDIAAVMGMGFPPYGFVVLSDFRSFLQNSRSVGIINGDAHGSGVESCSGLNLLDPNTFVQDWKNGQACMENSSSLVPT